MMLIQLKSRKTKVTIWVTLISFCAQLFYPSAALALTGGPSQPEVQSFEPVGTSDMVDVFSGDFTYNIPLMDVGGYPINLSYHSGITSDQEASWVGLGWNINPGVINRSMRGIPDDFNGDQVTTKFNRKKNFTIGANVAANLEVAGFKLLDALKKAGIGLSVSGGLQYNNYQGVGVSMGANISYNLASSNAGSLNAGLGLNLSSDDGVSINPSVSYEKANKTKVSKDKSQISTTGVTIGLPYNSTEGLKGVTLNASENIKNTKTNNVNTLQSAGGELSFASPSYVPNITMPLVNFSSSFEANLGITAFTVFPQGSATGYFNFQTVKNKTRENPAYGYLYAHKGAEDPNAMHDFNREKDGTMTEHVQSIALAQQTYDVYSVMGQGIGGSYRPARSDIGTVFDAEATNMSGSLDIGGVDLATADIFQGGANIRISTAFTTSGRWESGNETNTSLDFKTGNGSALYEPYYFKQAGELVAATDTSLFNAFGGYDPAYVQLKKHTMAPSTAENTLMVNGTGYSINRNTRNQREKRDQALRVLNAEEASTAGFEQEISYYTIPNNLESKTTMPRTQYHPQSHHISEITVYRPDGMRYVYGIAAYNKLQNEVSFAIDGLSGYPCTSGLTTYHQGSDDTQNNSRGDDHYFNSTSLPPYAHSYLLTAVVSPDYVDVTNNGFSDDDLGNYTKLNYVKAVSDYQWRTPYEDANYNEGFKSLNYDDKGNYVYGKKDIWYVQSIETRTHIAIFKLENRNDGYGVSGANGGINTGNHLQRLRSISLYAKPDYETGKGKPIKTVHFTYNYELCQGSGGSSLDNNDGTQGVGNSGKLTLKEVYFTYQNSYKGKLSAYNFHYADPDHDGTQESNFNYDFKDYDRWGNFKQQPANLTCIPTSGPLSNAEFPYSEQDSVKANLYAAAWNLTSIDLPSGGTIQVNYESDDYAFVQDKRAMQMFTLVGAAHNLTDIPDASLYDDVVKEFLIFNLADPVQANSDDLANTFVRERYFEELNGQPIQNLYFRFLLNITNQSDYEFVPGYMSIQNYGVVPSSKQTINGKTVYNQGYVQIKSTHVKGANSASAHPVSKAGWQFTRLYLPFKASGKEPLGEKAFSLGNIVSTFKSLANQLALAVEGYNEKLKSENFSRDFVASKSYIRLYNPRYQKFGGGSRVSKLEMVDNWKKMTGQSNYYDSQYGQEYNYTDYNEQLKTTISSGVAVYEPLLGGDENPFRQPSSYDVDKLLAPSNEYYQETPFGESMFPAPGVGYSKVTVRNITYDNVKNSSSGYVVHQFYTARDFPTFTHNEKATPIVTKPGISQLLGNTVSSLDMSQGFVVELNNMHGKPRSQEVYQEGATEPISKVEYYYKTQQTTDGTKLDNHVPVVHPDGSVATETVGMDYDIAVDSRNNYTYSANTSISVNVNGFYAFIPLVVAAAYPDFKQSKMYFNSMSVTKVINRYGVLDSTVAYDQGSKITTHNLLWDAETGSTLLTQTSNAFNDPVYSFTYPAHWAYDQMGLAYQNLGVSGSSLSAIGPYLVPGDELLVTPNSGAPYRAWVLSGGSSPNVVDRNDNTVSDGTMSQVEVIRSGRRNMASKSIGSVVSLKNPLQNGQLVLAQPVSAAYSDYYSSIINAASVEFLDGWRTFCDCSYANYKDYNDYVNGKKGNWRPYRNYVYLTDRTQSRLNENTDIRHDGSYKDFIPFWQYDNYQWTKDSLNWTWATEITTYSPRGQELENMDALGRYSAALYGYSDLLPISVGNNSRFSEIGFDSFEDYQFDGCPDDHFSFRKYKDQVNSQEAHSGRYSLFVAPGDELTIEKVIEECQ